ncbi:MAG: class I SAM-dependent methyltransferase [Clostridia bacterium]|nr:class I SAM-dependent methyltransferase [Clostridia bacterium]
MDRIKKLCSYLESCTTFADVGCDHGYCTEYMLKNNLCARAVISDISDKCLDKAKTLLKDYIQNGQVSSVCCFGLEDISKDTELVLIAGMGGEEIVSILKNSFIPRKFVFQPMKNCRAVREYLLSSGAEITADEVFESGGKFYFVLKGTREGNKTAYTDCQLDYGLNTDGADCQKFLKAELEKKLGYLQRELGGKARAEIELQVEKIRRLLKNER